MSRYAVLLFGLIAACESGSVESLPTIAASLPHDARDAQREFDRRVRSAFPVGTSENAAISALKANGFSVSPVGSDGFRSANIKRGDAICQTIWSARWRADAGELREVIGVYGLQCV